jgi:H+-transporting ATPase
MARDVGAHLSGRYFLLNNMTWFDKLGKSRRGVKNSMQEDFLTNLRRLTLVHERSSPSGEDYFRFESNGGDSKDGGAE